MKTCSKCGRPEGEVEFQVEKTRNGGLRSRPDCKECRKTYQASFRADNPTYFADYYVNNKRKVNAKCVEINRLRRHERYGLIAKLKSNPCVDCKGSFLSCVMDFDHRDRSTKVMDISWMVKRLIPWERVLEEISKCDLVCVCCHRLRTYHGNNSYKTRLFEHHSLVLNTLKSTTPCLDCGGKFKACQMDFDHVTLDKVSNIACLVGGSTKELLSEIAKCHLVCANCHRVRGSTGIRPDSVSHSNDLVRQFQDLVKSLPFPKDARVNPFPNPELLGTVPDKELAMMTGISQSMVAWYRRKAGVVLNRQGQSVNNRSMVETQ